MVSTLCFAEPIKLNCEYQDTDRPSGRKFESFTVDINKKSIDLFEDVISFRVEDGFIQVMAELSDEECSFNNGLCLNHVWRISRYSLKSDWIYTSDGVTFSYVSMCKIVNQADKKF